MAGMRSVRHENAPEAEIGGRDSHLIHHGLWTLDGDPISFMGFPYSQRMTVARLSNGSVLLHSPVQLTSARRGFVDRIGPVTHIVTPNKLHHLHLGAWADAYPAARLFAPPGLAHKRRDLRFAATLTDTPAPAWADRFRQIVIRGSIFMEEVLFFHIPSSTLIVGDLIENHDPAHFAPWQRYVGRLNRMIAPNGATPVNYRLSFLNRRKARNDLERVMDWRPKRVIVMHGPCIMDDAEAFLRRAFDWVLKP